MRFTGAVSGTGLGLGFGLANCRGARVKWAGARGRNLLRRKRVQPDMTGNLQRYSVRVSPKATLQGQYSAEICVKELVLGIPAEKECRVCTRPGGITPLLKRLGLPAEDVIAVMSRFGHEQAITLTASIDPEALQREGFEAA